MQDFDHEFAELQELLQKAELLHQWRLAQTYKAGNDQIIELNLRLGIREDAHARPVGATFDAVDLEFAMRIGGEGEFADITHCAAQLVVEGMAADGSDLRFAMHFDRHDLSQESTELHAHYHWQYGGNKLDGLKIEGLLLLEGPRFPSHPLDPILLVDFVLGHFHGGKRSDLLSRPEFIRYRRILHSSQLRYVAPFFAELSAAVTADPFVETALWPSLCGPQ